MFVCCANSKALLVPIIDFFSHLFEFITKYNKKACNNATNKDWNDDRWYGIATLTGEMVG